MMTQHVGRMRKLHFFQVRAFLQARVDRQKSLAVSWNVTSMVRNYIRQVRRYYLICARIARASAAGSAASVIGRPTTMWLAPAAIASAGVTTRT